MNAHAVHNVHAVHDASHASTSLEYGRGASWYNSNAANTGKSAADRRRNAGSGSENPLAADTWSSPAVMPQLAAKTLSLPPEHFMMKARTGDPA
jgi:hypothetical protein